LREVLESLLIVFVVLVTGSLGLAGVLRAVAPAYLKNNLVDVEIEAYQFLSLGVILCVVLILIPRFHISLRTLGFRLPGWQTLVLSGLTIIPILVGVALVSTIFDTLFPGFLQGNAREIVQGNQPVTSLQKILLLLWASVQAPLTEEPLFRGIVFQGLRNFFEHWLPSAWAVLAGALVSGLVFGAAHFEPHTFPILVLLGIALAYVFQFTRSLYCSALVHGINNFISVIVLFHGL
jgi:membrane protease YdiL (CAAX protease family)